MLLQNKILIEAQFFPPIESFAAILQNRISESNSVQTLFLEKNEHFQKGTYRNRCHIATSQGVQILSVPLSKGKHNQQPIKEVQIANNLDWQRPLWRTIQTAYGKAPFWEHYAPVIEPFFIKKYDYLFDYNLDILYTLFKILKLDKYINISFTSTYEPIFTEGVDFRSHSEARQCFTSTVRRYPQLFEDRNGFLPNLSILDLIMCCGNQSVSIITGEK